MSDVIQRSIPRVDALEKVTGAAVFTQDVERENMLYAKVLRSPYAHANIKSIDPSQALCLPGVRGFVCWENTPHVYFNQCTLPYTAAAGIEPVYDQLIFDKKVRFVGDEVAAVAAESEKTAEEAIRRIRVEYEELPAVLDPKEALRPDAPDVHDGCVDKNLACPMSHVDTGDFDKAYAAADVRFEGEVKLPIQKPIPMETHAAVAEYSSAGELTIYSTTQAPHPARLIIADVLSLPASKVRVMNPPHVGGGFGCRGGLSGKAELIAAVLAMQTHRPVRCAYTREEDFLATETRHSGYGMIRIGARRDGTITALEIDSIMNTGAYTSWGSTIPLKLFTYPSAVFHIPNQRHWGKCVYTNVMPAGAMRGFGNPQGMFLMEYAMHGLARQLGLDPLTLYEKNCIRPGEDWVLNFSLAHTELVKCIRIAAEKIGWEQKRGLHPTGRYRRGVGMGIGRHISMSDSSSGVGIRVDADGSVQLYGGMADIGNGICTTLPQIFASEFGVRMEDVHLSYGDTQNSPFDIGTHSTRCLYDRGLAVIDGAKRLKQEIFRFMAAHYGVAEGDLHMEDGIITDRDGRKWTLKEVVRTAGKEFKHFETIGRASFSGAVPWHAHAVELEVDMELGTIRVIRVVAVHDVGVAINPKIVEGQIEGGVLMSLGYALGEEVTFRPDGRPHQTSFHEYMVPTAVDAPKIEAIIVESKDPNGPFGGKGIGESSFIPTASAVADALCDATGIRMNEIPMTPERVLAAIRAGGVS